MEAPIQSWFLLRLSVVLILSYCQPAMKRGLLRIENESFNHGWRGSTCAISCLCLTEVKGGGAVKATTGSVKLVSTRFTDLVPVEQFNHKPMGMYDGGLLRLALRDEARGGLKQGITIRNYVRDH